MSSMSVASNCSNIYLIKMEIIEEMTVLITDVCMDSNYIKVYVPLDDRLRDKGYLTLISPRYAFCFAQILTQITKKTTVDIDSSQFTKPDKNKIKDFLFKKGRKKDEDYVNILLHKVIEAPSMKHIEIDVVKALIYDLVNRVLNAIVGGQVKIFRSKKLSRVNDVTFRTMLKTKCEEGNV